MNKMSKEFRNKKLEAMKVANEAYNLFTGSVIPAITRAFDLEHQTGFRVKSETGNNASEPDLAIAVLKNIKKEGERLQIKKADIEGLFNHEDSDFRHLSLEIDKNKDEDKKSAIKNQIQKTIEIFYKQGSNNTFNFADRPDKSFKTIVMEDASKSGNNHNEGHNLAKVHQHCLIHIKEVGYSTDWCDLLKSDEPVHEIFFGTHFGHANNTYTFPSDFAVDPVT